MNETRTNACEVELAYPLSLLVVAGAHSGSGFAGSDIMICHVKKHWLDNGLTLARTTLIEMEVVSDAIKCHAEVSIR